VCVCVCVCVRCVCVCVVNGRTVENVLKAMRLAGQLPLQTVCNDNPTSGLLQYELDFYTALWTFRHQTVYDPATRTVSTSQLLAVYVPLQ
jgi:hypothetical protein